MRTSTRGAVAVGLLVVSLAAFAGAAEQRIQGKKLLMKDFSLSESSRTVLVIGVERATEIPSIVGNPTISGAFLHVVANGGTGSDQTYSLDASGWHVLGTVGYKYLGPTGGDGDPVRLVIIKRTPSAKAIMKIKLDGSLGTQSMDVVPPNTGFDAGFTLSISLGDSYCTSFGSLAGGTDSVDTATEWKMLNPQNQPGCPVPTGTPTVCCNIPVGPPFPTSACADMTNADAGNCVLVGGTFGALGTTCNANGAFAEVCAGIKTVGINCCECPAPIGDPHPTYCFDTSNGNAVADCMAAGCTVNVFGAACGAVTGSCGGF